MQGFQVLVAGIEATVRQSIPPTFRVLDAVGLDGDRLLLAEGEGEPRATGIAPVPCLALCATARTLPLMQEVRGWMLTHGADAVPEIVVLDKKSPAALVERTLLDNLVAFNAGLAASALRQARRVARLRGELETLGAVRAGLDRFIGETGLAQLKRVFSTTLPDFETQIELVHGAPLRQMLPISSTGFAAIDLACTGSRRRDAFLARLMLVEEGRILAEWHVPAPAQDGWVRLGLPSAYAGLVRTLALEVEPVSPDGPCANLALGAHQPLPFAQLADASTGLPIAPHSLALRLYAAVPGSTPPHAAGTILPVDAQAPDRVPFALQALPVEELGRVTADRAPADAVPGPAVLFVPDVAAVLCRPGARGRIAAACPAGARGLMASVGIHASVPSAAEARLAVETGDPQDETPTVVVASGAFEEVSFLFAEPLRQPSDILLSAEPIAGAGTDDDWVVFRDLRIYR